MVFAILMSLLIVLIISVVAFFYFTYTNHKSKECFSDSETTFLSSDKDFDSEGKVAVVKCSSSRDYQKEKLQHSQMIDCRMFLDKYGFSDFCKYGCLGYGTCVYSCPEKAIILVNNTAIVTDGCTGCGICADKCPQKIIEIVDLKDTYYKQCSLPENQQNENCSSQCISCKKCDSNDFKIEYCPHMCIKKTDINSNKGFKFWKFCYSIFKR